MPHAHEPALAALIADHAARGVGIEIVGSGTRRAIGPPARPAVAVSTAELAGIVAYEPEELILICGAGTPVAQLQDLLAQQNQMFAFEPADLGPLLGTTPGGGTAGGMVATNLAGSRRISHGAVRDHTLGFRAINGRGEAFKSGSRVMKNVTGYDLAKLFSGSWGQLGVMTEVTLKVLPRPEDVATVVILGLTNADGIAALTAGMGSAHEVSGAAHLPALPASVIPAVAGFGQAVSLLRLEGPAPSVAARVAALSTELSGFGSIAVLGAMDSLALWRALTNATPLAERPELTVWRVSVPPTAGPATMAAVGDLALGWFDWSGGLLWLGLMPGEPDGGAQRVRAAIGTGGGHATLIRAAAEVRASTPVFPPLDPAMAALEARIKAGFDPSGILNPGRR